MGDTINVYDQEAIEKLHELTHEKVCMFCTHDKMGEMIARPMSTNKTDGYGNIWFLSDRLSELNDQINGNPKVDLLYVNTKDASYCTIKGIAQISRDQGLINELWNPIAKAWFKEGKEDPRIAVIKVTPEDAHYWDMKSGKFVGFLKMAASAITGLNIKDGRQGEIKV